MATKKVHPASKPTPAFRAIAAHEETLSATEIVERFEVVSGHVLHPTNAGKAAKELNLDYVEVPSDDPSLPWKSQKRYAVLDMPLIFERLQALAARRAKYE